MILLALQIDDSLIKIGVFLVAGGIWLINHILRKNQDRPEPPARPRPVPGRRPVPQDMMGQNEVDQFLDEVLGRRRVAPPPAQPQTEMPQTDVVVLRPTAASSRPAGPAARREPRRVARSASQRPGRPSGTAKGARAQPSGAAAPPTLADSYQQELARSAIGQMDLGVSSGLAQQGVDQAAAATQAAAALQPASQPIRPRSALDSAGLVALLKSPADIRRAIMLREVLGAPISRRRQPAPRR